MKRKSIRPEFVELMPDELKEGVLYISVPFATAAHKCPCGCGETVVTPIRPTDWTLVWDGETLSLDPSIGNWSLPCRSHYWIIKNRVVWARKWNFAEIEATREDDRRAKRRYFGRIRR
ncbi:MAG: hypothetical protein JRM74_02570 [Nitrososphaerota archaeon]|nr:hypothetical protein [Nitrososphaerota archaeon]